MRHEAMLYEVCMLAFGGWRMNTNAQSFTSTSVMIQHECLCLFSHRPKHDHVVLMFSQPLFCTMSFYDRAFLNMSMSPFQRSRSSNIVPTSFLLIQNPYLRRNARKARSSSKGQSLESHLPSEANNSKCCCCQLEF